jgi:hypothetical protein
VVVWTVLTRHFLPRQNTLSGTRKSEGSLFASPLLPFSPFFLLFVVCDGMLFVPSGLPAAGGASFRELALGVFWWWWWWGGCLN